MIAPDAIPGSVVTHGTPSAMARLKALILHAKQRSPYYAEALKGCAFEDIGDLPTLSKAQLMDHWDDIVCDRRLRLRDMRDLVQRPASDELHLGEYRVLSTSGTTRREAILAFNRREWARILAGLGRARRWRAATAATGPEVIVGAGADNRISISQELARSIQRRNPNTEFVDCRQPLSSLVGRLNAIQPASISGYASILAMLVEEQDCGRLRIAPRQIVSSAEVCSPALKARLRSVFGAPVYEMYMMGEVGVVAASCSRRGGMHVMNDDVIVESVADDGRVVADGKAGAQLLVSVLGSRTLPLIRYEVPDQVVLTAQHCECGLPGPMVCSILGRTSEVLELEAAGGAMVRLSAWEFDRSIQMLGILQWQLATDGRTLTLNLLPGCPEDKAEEARRKVEVVVRRAGSRAPVRVNAKAELRFSPGGKLDRLLQAENADRTGPGRCRVLGG